MKILKKRISSPQPFEVAEQLAREVDQLTVAVAKLRAENNDLRRRTKLQPHIRVVQQAAAAARLLALWYCAGYRTGRMTALSFGMPERTWFYARALLMVARVHTGRAFTTTDPAEIERALALAIKRCEKDPDILMMRLPLSRQPQRRL